MGCRKDLEGSYLIAKARCCIGLSSRKMVDHLLLHRPTTSKLYMAVTTQQHPASALFHLFLPITRSNGSANYQLQRSYWHPMWCSSLEWITSGLWQHICQERSYGKIYSRESKCSNPVYCNHLSFSSCWSNIFIVYCSRKSETPMQCVQSLALWCASLVTICNVMLITNFAVSRQCQPAFHCKNQWNLLTACVNILNQSIQLVLNWLDPFDHLS